jgi:signal transduction histidine kinase
MDVGGQRMYAGILRDATELKRHESALVDARDSADLANRAKTEFLANMSHELRTPLNAIIGFAEIMHLELFGSVGPPEYREYVIDIQNSGHHLLEVINDILDMSKIETGEMALTDAEVDIPKIVASSLRLVGERAAKSAVKLVNDGFDGLPKICADVRMFMQILLNPLSNAVKFTEPGGLVSISAKSMRRADCVSLSPTRASARHPTI